MEGLVAQDSVVDVVHLLPMAEARDSAVARDLEANSQGIAFHHIDRIQCSKY